MRKIDWFILSQIFILIGSVLWFFYLLRSTDVDIIILNGDPAKALFIIVFFSLSVTLFSRFFGYLIHKPHKIINWFYSLLGTIFIFIIIWVLTSLYGHFKDYRLLGSDVALDSATLEFNSIALNDQHKGRLACGNYCLRLLLNEQVNKVIITNVKKGAKRFGFERKGVGFWFEKRKICPEIILKLVDLRADYSFKSDGLEGRDIKRQFLLKLNNDLCLISAKTILKPGETIARIARVRRYMQISLFRQEADSVKLLFQKTRKAKDVRLETVLNDKFGINLHIYADHLKDRTYQTIVRKLDSDTEFNENFYMLLADYFGRPDLTEKDINVVLRIIDDRRLPIINGSSKAVKRALELRPDLATQFARILFERMVVLEEETRFEPSRKKDLEIFQLNIAIVHLPQNNYLADIGDVKNILFDKKSNRYQTNITKYLEVYEQNGVDILLDVIDVNFKKENDSGRRHNFIFYKAIQSLCRMGQRGYKRPNIMQRVAKWPSNVFIDDDFYTVYAPVVALLNLGVNVDVLWRYMVENNAKITRENYLKILTFRKNHNKCAVDYESWLFYEY